MERSEPAADDGWTHTVAATAFPRFDSYLIATFPSLTRSRAQKLIAAGQALLEGKAAKPSQKVKAQARVQVRLAAPPSPAKLEAEAIPLEILFEDEHLLVLNKPAGLVVHPAHGNWSGTLVNALLHHCGTQLSRGSFSIGGEVRPGIVHRLDKNTSGVMVVAKNDQAHEALGKQFRLHTITRLYHGLCWGELPKEGEWLESLGRHPKERKLMAVKSNGKRAHTKFRRLESFGMAAYFEAELLTGRTHQIRVHFAHHGFPLLADPTYATASRSPRRAKEEGMKALKKTCPALAQAIEELTMQESRQLLHAHCLGFVHPASHEPLTFRTNPPPDFESTLRELRRCAGKRA